MADQNLFALATSGVECYIGRTTSDSADDVGTLTLGSQLSWLDDQSGDTLIVGVDSAGRVTLTYTNGSAVGRPYNVQLSYKVTGASPSCVGWQAWLQDFNFPEYPLQGEIATLTPMPVYMLMYVGPGPVSVSGTANADGSFAPDPTSRVTGGSGAIGGAAYVNYTVALQPVGGAQAIGADPTLMQFAPMVNASPAPIDECNYNCACDDASGNRTLKQLRDDLARRLGYGAQVDNLPPGMTDLLNSFLEGAQRALYRRYDVLRTERFFTWNMTAGTRFYDLAENRDTCTRRLDPRKITWAGVSEGCGYWTELRCGINPLLYTNESAQFRPQFYEIRQCIEVWPPPPDDTYQLRLKGHFGLDPFAADTDTTTIDDELVFLLALANAKAHYGKPDANNYIQQLETMMMNLVAGAHQTRRYVPGTDHRGDYVYTRPVPTEPFTS